MGRREIDEEQLLDEALNEFSSYSFDEASINRIISSAGIAKGSFYYRFPNKYDLYIHLLKEGNRKKWDFIKAETESETADWEGDIFSLFIKQAEIGMRFAAENPRYHELGKMFSREKGSPIYAKALKDLEMDDESDLSRIMEHSYNSGVFKETFSREFITRITASLFYSFDDIFFKNEEFELDRALSFLREFVFFLKHGLAKDTRADGRNRREGDL